MSSDNWLPDCDHATDFIRGDGTMRPREMYIAAPTVQREISEAERRGESMSTDTITGPIRRAQAYFEQADAVRVLEHAIDTLLYKGDQWERDEAERALIDAVALLRERATAIEAEMRQEGCARRG